MKCVFADMTLLAFKNRLLNMKEQTQGLLTGEAYEQNLVAGKVDGKFRGH